MSPQCRWFAAACSLILCPAAAAAGETLAPKDALLYAEASKPGELIREIQALFKDLDLDPKPAEPGGAGFPLTSPDGGRLAALLAPEMAAEADRFESASLALLGFDEKHRPRLLAVLRTGTSHLPGILLKARLAGSPADRVAVVEGVTLHQFRDAPDYDQMLMMINPPGVITPDEKVPVDPRRWTVASASGVIILGSDQDITADAVRRLKGKAEGGLVVPDAEAGTPGVAIHLDCARLAALLDEMARDNDAGTPPLGWETARNLLRPSEVRSASARLTVAGGALAFDLKLRYADDHQSPLARLCDGATAVPGVTGDGFRVSFGLPAEGRAEKLLAVADAVAAATGTLGPLPSEAVAEQRDAGTDWRAILGGVESLSASVNPDGAIGVVIGVDSARGEGLTAALPGLLSLIADRELQPVTETINGVRIRSLPAEGTPWGKAISFASHAGRVGIATSPEAVVALVTGRTETGAASVVGSWNWSRAAVGLLEPLLKADPTQQFRMMFGGIGGPAPAAGDSEEDGEAEKALRKAFADLPPVVWTITGRTNELRLTVRQEQLGTVLPGVVRRWLQYSALMSEFGAYGGIGVNIWGR